MGEVGNFTGLHVRKATSRDACISLLFIHTEICDS